MSVREFAAHLGVSDRMVSKWEAGGQAIRPRPVNQAALDTSLAHASAEVQVRFNLAVCADGSPLVQAGSAALAKGAAVHLVRHPEDGKLMSLVPAAIGPLGAQNTPTWLPGFYIDVFPTTNAEYAKFVFATGHRPPTLWSGAVVPEGAAQHPVVGVSWHDAVAYAAWAAKELPTAAQWERAARGPAGSVYPWGEQASPARANVRESRIKATTPVDWYDNGASVYGVYDLCGNIWEWCADAHGRGQREVRGGSYSTPLHRSVAASWHEVPADAPRDDVGFRCVLALAAMLELLSI